MDSKTEIMVSLAVAMGTNCIPCFDHIYSRAKEVGIADQDIQQVIEIADKVKNGASIFLRNAVHEVLGTAYEPEHPCCSNGPKSSCC